MVKAITRTQNVVVKAPSQKVRLVNTTVQAPVVIVKLLESEAQDLINVLAPLTDETSVAVVAALTAQLYLTTEATEAA